MVDESVGEDSVMNVEQSRLQRFIDAIEAESIAGALAGGVVSDGVEPVGPWHEGAHAALGTAWIVVSLETYVGNPREKTLSESMAGNAGERSQN
jgi:hypothetical protein